MRLLFECRACSTHYLPPESMRYEAAGEDASPLWCSECQVRMRELGIAQPAREAAVALALAKLSATPRAPLVDEPVKADVRPSRPAKTARARSGPGKNRSKLR